LLTGFSVSPERWLFTYFADKFVFLKAVIASEVSDFLTTALL